MKKETMFLLINMVLITMVSIIFIMIYDAQPGAPRTKLDYYFGEVVTTSNWEELNARPIDFDQYIVVLGQFDVKNAKGERIASGYHTEAKNMYGVVELYIFVEDELISVAVQHMDQSEGFDVFAVEHVEVDYQDIHYQDIIDVDGITGPTTNYGTFSKATVKESILEVIKIVWPDYDPNPEPDKPYSEWFGNDYISLETNNHTANPYINKEEEIRLNDEIIGYVYTVRGSGDYCHGDCSDPSTGFISVVVGLDLDGDIVGIAMPLDVYGHTKTSTGGTYYNAALNFARTNYLDVNIEFLPDEVSGVTIDPN
ncbi:MAG: hypothetical protein IH571_05235, partial [Acholeplasmataceae bacterium]|nr:hypothetical protein [Acholeplasmataceae bacterium]